MDNNSPTPQDHTPPTAPSQSQTSASQTPGFAPTTPAIAPQKPIDPVKYSKIGWVFFALSLIIAAVGLAYGYVVVISVITAAIGARLGLQAKNKALATASIIFCALMLTLYIIATFSS